jgi:hypothetical protein
MGKKQLPEQLKKGPGQSFATFCVHAVEVGGSWLKNNNHKDVAAERLRPHHNLTADKRRGWWHLHVTHSPTQLALTRMPHDFPALCHHLTNLCSNMTFHVLTAMSMQMRASLDHYNPDDGSTHLWNVGLLQRDYTALHPWRLSNCYTEILAIKFQAKNCALLRLSISAFTCVCISARDTKQDYVTLFNTACLYIGSRDFVNMFAKVRAILKRMGRGGTRSVNAVSYWLL